jgi:hypothetical protein
MARIPAAQENAGLNAMLVPSTTYYLSLHTADPGTTGASEVTGGSYARQAITFGSASAGVQSSTNSQTFAGMPSESGGCPYAGVWTLASGGTYLGGLTTTGLSGAIPSGASLTCATGQTTWTLS